MGEGGGLRELADLSIRRACGFAALGIGTVMLALSHDLALAFRSGGDLTALVCLAMLLQAWRAPRRDVRDLELWSLLPGTPGAYARNLPRTEAQRLLGRVMRERLLRHAEWAGMLAVGFWVLAVGVQVAHAIGL